MIVTQIGQDHTAQFVCELLCIQSVKLFPDKETHMGCHRPFFTI